LGRSAATKNLFKEKYMKKLLLIGLIAAGLSASVYGQTKKQDIIKLLDITNTRSLAEQMFDLMLPNIEQMAPDAPSTFWAAFKSKLDIDGFVNLFIPIYDRHFSHDDIKKLIQFYESPIGKKLLNVTPLITEESYRIGEEWGQNLGLEVLNELQRQGYY
jgi:hypothetical protein